ncbi:MAG: hypothetical protein MSG64_02560 [Pyrinomonadaceae bacterium MAG19_C2-C3]|nr:hypothetical protein [Pyrinomonadaceae bacterium MAG19_C2-C3]
MSKTITIDSAKDERVDYKAMINDYIEKMTVIHKEIAETQDNTERLQDETQVILDRLK